MRELTKMLNKNKNLKSFEFKKIGSFLLVQNKDSDKERIFSSQNSVKDLLIYLNKEKRDINYE